MSLNTAIVLAKDPVNGQLMVDPLGQNSPLPIDVVPIIFQNLKTDLPSVALVCKKWKTMADDKLVREKIRPAQAFGVQEWNDYIGVDAGKEPPLPRRAYETLEKEGGLLTFIPQTVKVTKENGIVEIVTLDNLEAIGNLVENPKKGHSTRYSIVSWKKAFEEKTKPENPHWVWIKKDVCGRGKWYDTQQEIAKQMKVSVSGLIDTVISVFMEYIRSGERNFIWDPVNFKWTNARVNDIIDGFRWISLSFTPTGLRVIHDRGDGGDYVGFAPARKS